MSEPIKRPARYGVATLAELINGDWYADRVIADIDNVYQQFPALDHPGNDMGTDEKWLRIMSEYPSFLYCLVYNGEEVVGYWFCLPVSESVFRSGIRGENINRDLDVFDICDVGIPDEYHLYFVDLFTSVSHRNFATNRMLFTHFVSFLKTAARNGCFFRNIFAHASSHDAFRLCEQAGFRFVAPHIDHRMEGPGGSVIPTRIYSLDMATSDASKVLEFDKDLSSLYKAHYGVASG